jgi:hypothetical protein
MRTYEELVQKFSIIGAFSSFPQKEKQKWIDELTIEEIKVLINGLSNVAYTGLWDPWIEYMEMIILIKIELEREKKLKKLGI